MRVWSLKVLGGRCFVSPAQLQRAPYQSSSAAARRHPSGKPTPGDLLPPELWTLIIDHTHDWELAQHLRVHTYLCGRRGASRY